MPAAARVSDLHTCPKTPAGPILQGASTVLICGMPAARISDMVTCTEPEFIVTGEKTVLIEGKPAARMGDMTEKACPSAGSGVITTGCPTVLIGSTYQETVLKVAAETGSPFCEPFDAGQCEEEQTPPPLDQSRYPEQRKQSQKVLDQAFPNLGENYEVLAPATSDYNCIAHTLSKNSEWVNPQMGSSNPFSEMDRIYGTQGYSRDSTMNFSYESGVQKVAVYGKLNSNGSIQKITHGAIQDRYGTWESKLGMGPLIRHETPEVLTGPAYGEPVAVYRKLK